MKERLTQLLEQFLEANTATKITLVLSTIVIIGIASISGWFANRPDFVEHFSGLSAAQSSSYKAALAEAGIPFKSSPPPGPYSIWIDSADTIIAEAQVARGGFLPATKGIPVSTTGAQSAFMSAGARSQMMDKREWQECEMLLETLDFVERATVVGSKSQRSPFRRDIPATISVTLGVRYGMSLSGAQARNVATLVRGRFNVPIENIIILDEDGSLLHDGNDLSSPERRGDLFEQKRRFESETERKVNQQLTLALGQGMASVTVSSDWSLDETESIKEAALPGATTFKSKSSDETSALVEDGVGGPAGVSSNITQDFGNQNAGAGGAAPTSRKSTTDETRSVVGRETEHRISRTPKIERMSISLVVDQSVPAEKLEDLDNMVKAAVGFVADRDEFQSLQIALASVERDEEGNPIPPEEPEPLEPPNAYLQLFLDYGLELLAGLAFIIVLAKTLRAPSTSKRQRKQALAEAEAAVAEEEAAVAAIEFELANADPVLLARLKVEELVKSEPERVSEILEQWATEELATTGPINE